VRVSLRADLDDADVDKLLAGVDQWRALRASESRG